LATPNFPSHAATTPRLTPQARRSLLLTSAGGRGRDCPIQRRPRFAPAEVRTPLPRDTTAAAPSPVQRRLSARTGAVSPSSPLSSSLHGSSNFRPGIDGFPFLFPMSSAQAVMAPMSALQHRDAGIQGGVLHGGKAGA